MLFLTDKQKQYCMLWYISGIFIGTILFQYVYHAFGNEIVVYGGSLFDSEKIDYIAKGKLFVYILQYRLKWLLLLLLFSVTRIKKVLHSIVILFLGVRYSILISFLTIISKKYAIINFALMTVPHELLYVISCFMIFGIVWNMECEAWNVFRVSQKVKRIVSVFIVYCISIILEVYLSPWMLTMILLEK